MGAALPAALAAPPEPPEPKDRFDALGHGSRPAQRPQPVTPAPGLVKEGTRVQMEVRLGVPTFLWAGEEGRLDRALPAQAGPVNPRTAARGHLERYGHLYHLTKAEAQAAKIKHVHDTGRGASVVIFGQEIGGIEVFRDELKLALDRNGNLVALSGYLTAPDIRTPGFNLKAAEALAIALADMTEYPFVAADLESTGGSRRGGYERYVFAPGVEATTGLRAASEMGARQVYYRLMDGLEPAWALVLDVGDLSELETTSVGHVVSAASGEILMRHGFTRSESYSYRVFADPNGLIPDDGPQGTDPSPHPTGVPDAFLPPFVLPNLISLESGPISTGDPWLPPAATLTTGNNVDAYADLTSPQGFNAGDLRASTTSTNTFDRTYDPTQAPGVSGDQRQAAVTQLFYTNNWLHDWFYDSGFDEASGNAQASNYGRGGSAGDRLLAEGQDYSGLNNATMSTPPDGFNPRMTMFVFNVNGQIVEINSPGGIAGNMLATGAVFGPADFDLTDDVVLVNDGVGTITDGCETPFSTSVTGMIALIDRGSCPFVQKVQNAEAEGAVGVIVANNVATSPVTMGGTGSIGIPSVMISMADGSDIKANLPGVNATLTGESVSNDGTIDNAIIAHEWGHYISNRLIGNASGLSNQQGGGMGEGWGDFHALLMMVRPEDISAPANTDWAGAYALSGYPESAIGSNSYYWSIRRTPYSTDFNLNPLTFKHIENGVALPTTAPLQFGQDGASNAEVHNTGEVWANMLWECYAALLRDTQGPSPRLTFAQAQQRMKDYLVGGYKMTPSSPTFTEARDAILGVVAASDWTDHSLFWKAFARRGLGSGAVSPDRFSTTHSGVVESFGAGGDLGLESIVVTDDVSTNCLPDGSLDNNEIGTLTVTLLNTGNIALNATTGTVSAGNSNVSFPGGTALAFSPTVPSGLTVATVPIAVAGASGIEDGLISITFEDPDARLRGGGGAIRVNSDSIPDQSASDDVESDASAWTPGFDSGLSVVPTFVRLATSGLAHHWIGRAPDTSSDIYLDSPPLSVSATGSFSFTFSHRHDFESSGIHRDGGVIEISTNGGATWNDIGGSASPGYGGTVTLGGGNPIEGQQAYVGFSASYPTFQPVTVSLGTAYQGQTVQVRFRIGTDSMVGTRGWEIDDLSFTGIDNTPFPVVVAHDATCDGDSDTFFDSQDCAPADGNLWSLPATVIDLSATGAATTNLSWSAPSTSGGTAAATFDLIRSTTATGFGSGTCLLSNSSATGAVDGTIPASLSYYLVGSRNGCGRSIETGTAGAGRTVITCVP